MFNNWNKVIKKEGNHSAVFKGEQQTYINSSCNQTLKYENNQPDKRTSNNGENNQLYNKDNRFNSVKPQPNNSLKNKPGNDKNNTVTIVSSGINNLRRGTNTFSPKANSYVEYSASSLSSKPSTSQVHQNANISTNRQVDQQTNSPSILKQTSVKTLHLSSHQPDGESVKQSSKTLNKKAYLNQSINEHSPHLTESINQSINKSLKQSSQVQNSSVAHQINQEQNITNQFTNGETSQSTNNQDNQATSAQRNQQPAVDVEGLNFVSQGALVLQAKAVLDVLKCNGCHGWMIPEHIVSCECLLMCQLCGSKTKNCAQCGNAFIEDMKISQLYQRLAKVIHHPCPNEGCPSLIAPGVNHESTCEYRPFTCYCCESRVPLKHAWSHFESFHPKHMPLKDTNVNLNWLNFVHHPNKNPMVCCFTQGQCLWITLIKVDNQSDTDFTIMPLLVDGNVNIKVKFEFKYKDYSCTRDKTISNIEPFYTLSVPKQVVEDWQCNESTLDIYFVVRKKRKMSTVVKKKKKRNIELGN